jgi:two-component system, NtrC family, response regulator HydG
LEKISILQQDDWKSITDAMPDGLMVLDAQAHVVAINPAFTRITGFSSDEIVGNSCSVLGCNACPKPGLGRGCVLSGGAQGETVSCNMVHKSGRTLYLWKRASLLAAADGSVLGAVETLIDDNELKPAESPCHVLYQLNDGRRLLVGLSPAMATLMDALDGLAIADTPILIQGESGSGKELVARLLHQLGPRSKRPMIKLNCATLQPEEFDLEPWHADSQPKTDVILDEISDLPLASQKRLALSLEKKRDAGLRVIALSNRDLGELANHGKFSGELWPKICTVMLTVPPLRKRPEDLPLLIERLLSDLCLRQGRPTARVDRDALNLLQNYSWPGNVRELINALEYALMQAPKGLIQATHLPPSLSGTLFVADDASHTCDERQRLILALRKAGGNRSEAARLLGVSRVTVWKRMQRYGIDPKAL